MLYIPRLTQLPLTYTPYVAIESALLENYEKQKKSCEVAPVLVHCVRAQYPAERQGNIC